MGSIVVRGTEVEVPFATDLSLLGKLPTRARRAEVVQAILHHDACFSARTCFAALQGRGLSTHFCIDNDGTVFQFADPGTREAFHAVGHLLPDGPDDELVPAGFNRRSIGIDLSNAVETRFASRYTPRRERAILRVGGRPYTGLLPYPCQIEAALALLVELRALFPGIAGDHRDDMTWRGDLTPDTPGIWAHGQVNRFKFDPFGFPLFRLGKV